VLISQNVKNRLAAGQFVCDRTQREHPQGFFKQYVRLEQAVFTNRLTDLLQVIDWLNDPNIPWVSVTGAFGAGKTSFARALAECLPIEQLIWLDTPYDADQFSAHLARAFRQAGSSLFDSIKALSTPHLFIINQADNLLTPQGRLSIAEHKTILDALLASPHARVLWLGEQPPPANSLPLSVQLALPPLKKADVTRLIQRVMANVAPHQQEGLIRLTHGHPWRVRLLWRWLKQQNQFSRKTPVAPSIAQLLQAEGSLEIRLLAQQADDWSAEVMAVLAMLSLSQHPLTRLQIHTGLKAVFPAMKVDLLNVLEQTGLIPFIPRTIPAQLGYGGVNADELALYRLAPPIRVWLKQQPLPWHDAQRALVALWQYTLEHPDTDHHMGTRWIRKTLLDLQQASHSQDLQHQMVLGKMGTGQMGPSQMGKGQMGKGQMGKGQQADIEQIKAQLNLAIQNGMVLQQLEWLTWLAQAYQQHQQWAEATSTLHHCRSLAQLSHGHIGGQATLWAENATTQLQQLTQLNDDRNG
jgi:hypothetical protein